MGTETYTYFTHLPGQIIVTNRYFDQSLEGWLVLELEGPENGLYTISSAYVAASRSEALDVAMRVCAEHEAISSATNHADLDL